MASVASFFVSATIAVALTVQTLGAAELDAPTGEVILTISGEVEQTNSEVGAVLDRAMLEAMERTTIVTTTIWTSGAQTFEGVELATLVETLGIQGSVLFATAINDYTVEVPISDAIEGGPIVAYAANGSEMSVRDKGPLWLIYPFDSNSEYRSEVIYSRSIWQLNRIEAKN